MTRLELAQKSLLGVSIGDAFGESFFGEQAEMLKHIHYQTMPLTSWEFTDDTVMAIAVFEQLEQPACPQTGLKINQDNLAQAFSKKHDLDPNRGYGATARRVLRAIGEGKYWKPVAESVFEGMGSMGNGAAMRVSSIGAYFYDDIKEVERLANLSAEITHTHIEGKAGAIAVAVATAMNTQAFIQQQNIEPNTFINAVAEILPECDLKYKIKKAATIPLNYHIETLKSILGNGTKIQAGDTVPFCIWCAAHHLNDFETALWKAVSILGDRDTICAIVGGITIMGTPIENIPNTWLTSVENIESSIFRNNGK